MKVRSATLALRLAVMSIFCGRLIAAAPMSLPDAINLIDSVEEYREVALSPDGRQVAWVKRIEGSSDEVPSGSGVFTSSTFDGNEPRRVSARLSSSSASDLFQEASPSWSPDGRTLAFLSDARSEGQLQLYVTDKVSSVAQVTHLQGNVSTPRWSPDGRKIGVLYTPGTSRAAGPTAAAREETGVAGEQTDTQRLAIVDVATRRLSLLSPAGLYVYDYDWSPDGTKLVATAAPGPGDNSWYVAQLWVIDALEGAAASLLAPNFQIAAPRWSPDGRTVAFIGGLNSDEGVANGDVYCIATAGGVARNLTKNLAASAYWLAWAPSSKKILFAAAVDGGSGIAMADTATQSPPQILWQGAETITGPAGFARGLSLDRKGERVGVIRTAFDHSSQIYVGKIGAWRPVTPALSSQHLWGRTQNIRWQNDDWDVQGWLQYPADFDATRQYPLIVWVHGGPASLTSPHWPSPPFYPDALLAAHGYFVFYPNPRGSAGFGEAYKKANIRDLGGGDLRDILTGLERLSVNRSIDTERIGIGGWSYGADMTLWALTQTTRFRAAFAGAGTADLLSYFGQNDFNAWLLPYFGASVYDDPQVYAKSSPINFVRNVRTPTLLAVGDSDVESPALQSREYWNALKAFKVRTELVIYPHEGHRLRTPKHAKDLMIRIATWFDENMPEQKKH